MEVDCRHVASDVGAMWKKTTKAKESPLIILRLADDEQYEEEEEEEEEDDEDGDDDEGDEYCEGIGELWYDRSITKENGGTRGALVREWGNEESKKCANLLVKRVDSNFGLAMIVSAPRGNVGRELVEEERDGESKEEQEEDRQRKEGEGRMDKVLASGRESSPNVLMQDFDCSPRVISGIAPLRELNSSGGKESSHAPPERHVSDHGHVPGCLSADTATAEEGKDEALEVKKGQQFKTKGEEGEGRGGEVMSSVGGEGCNLVVKTAAAGEGGIPYCEEKTFDGPGIKGGTFALMGEKAPTLREEVATGRSSISGERQITFGESTMFSSSMPALSDSGRCGSSLRANESAGAEYSGDDQPQKEKTDSLMQIAITWLRKAAEQGDAFSQNKLGISYNNGEGTPIDLSKACYWYRKAAEQGDADGQFNLGYCFFHAKGVPKNVTEAAKWYQRAAEQDHAKAQTNLGYCYESGVGVPKDVAKAFKWYCKGAEQGYAQAQYNMGRCLMQGIGVDVNHNEASEWYQKAAEQGLPYAQCSLGLCFRDGQGVTYSLANAEEWFLKSANQGYKGAQRNLGLLLLSRAKGFGGDDLAREGLAWIQKAADNGDFMACHDLGECYRNGLGVEKDERQAAEWYRKSAFQGNEQSQFNLGYLYFHGIGVVRDLVEAVKWFKESSARGNLRAQTYLGYCYGRGAGVDKNEAEAVNWYRKAAAKGFSLAEHNLGWCYENGIGVSRDSAEAVAWYEKAAGHGCVESQSNLGLCFRDGLGVEKDLVRSEAWFRQGAEKGLRSAQRNLGFLLYEKAKGALGVDETILREAVSWLVKSAEHGEILSAIQLGSCHLKHQGVGDKGDAAKWYRKAALRGSAEAQCNLGYLYFNGIGGVGKNEAEGMGWFKQAAEQGHARAQTHLGFCFEKGAGVAMNGATAAAWYQKAAEQGYAQAQHNLGWCYEKEGSGIQTNYETSAAWYMKAAAQGLAVSQSNLGVCFRDGKGVEKNLETAESWFLRSAEQGLRGAQRNLGFLLYDKWKVTGDQSAMEAALKWLRMAAECGDASAQNWLGNCLSRGEGVAQDHTEATNWYKKAALQGDASAQCSLGYRCFFGTGGVPVNEAEGIEWYTRAANHGDAMAQALLGFCYEKGIGVVADARQAVDWYRKSADQGQMQAQHNLGLCYENGIGVAQDSIESAKWYYKAARQGFVDSKNNLALCYRDGKGVAKDLWKAAYLLFKDEDSAKHMAEVPRQRAEDSMLPSATKLDEGVPIEVAGCAKTAMGQCNGVLAEEHLEGCPPPLVNRDAVNGPTVCKEVSVPVDDAVKMPGIQGSLAKQIEGVELLRKSGQIIDPRLEAYLERSFENVVHPSKDKLNPCRKYSRSPSAGLVEIGSAGRGVNVRQDYREAMKLYHKAVFGDSNTTIGAASSSPISTPVTPRGKSSSAFAQEMYQQELMQGLGEKAKGSYGLSPPLHGNSPRFVPLTGAYAAQQPSLKVPSQLAGKPPMAEGQGLPSLMQTPEWMKRLFFSSVDAGRPQPRTLQQQAVQSSQELKKADMQRLPSMGRAMRTAGKSEISQSAAMGSSPYASGRGQSSYGVVPNSVQQSMVSMAATVSDLASSGFAHGAMGNPVKSRGQTGVKEPHISHIRENGLTSHLQPILSGVTRRHLAFAQGSNAHGSVDPLLVNRASDYHQGAAMAMDKQHKTPEGFSLLRSRNQQGFLPRV